MHNAERLVLASCSAAVLTSDTGTATEDHCHNAGKLHLRGHCCSEVVLSHMLHREGLGRYDSDTSFYNMLVPWAEGQVTMSDVMRHASVHSCFHVALAGRGSSRSQLGSSRSQLWLFQISVELFRNSPGLFQIPPWLFQISA